MAFNSRNRQPETLDDWIALMQAAKDKYGNLKVRYCEDCHSTDGSEYFEFEDVRVATPPVSLLQDNNSTEDSYFLFVY